MFKLNVNKNRIELAEVQTITSGSKNSIEVKFCFSDEWAGLKKTVFFRAGSSKKEVTASVVLGNTLPNTCIVPSEVLLTPNRYLYCGVRGKLGNGDTIIPTVWVRLGEIMEGVSGPEEGDETLSQDQILDYIDRKQDKLFGKKGQFVGFNELGEAEAQDFPENIGGDGGSGDGSGSGSGGEVILPENLVNSFNGRTGDVVPKREDYAYFYDVAGSAEAVNDALEEYKVEQEELLDDKLSNHGGTVTGPLLFVEEAMELASSESGTDNSNQTGVVYSAGGISKTSDGPLPIHSVSNHVSFAEGENKSVLSGVEGDETQENTVPNFGQLNSAVNTAKEEAVSDAVDEAVKQANSNAQSLVNDALADVPTKVSDLTDADEYAKKEYVKEEIRQAQIEAGGTPGTPGEPGKDGLSAYQIAVQNGFVGTEQEWLASLKGEPGEPGEDGFSPTVSLAPNDTDDGTIVTITDITGSHTFEVLNGEDGEPGAPGAPGKDATINGENILEIIAGENVHIEQMGGKLTISATGGGAPSDQQFVNAPIGVIVAWYDTAETIPAGWHVCDGEDGTIDLRDKFVLGAGDTHPVGEEGGEEEVTLTVEQMPKHNHSGDARKSRVLAPSQGYAGVFMESSTSGSGPLDANTIPYAGSSQPHPNMPPYYALLYIQKIGPTPTGGGASSPQEVYSEEETLIGTWFGKPLYRICVSVPASILQGFRNSSATDVTLQNVIPSEASVLNVYGFVAFYSSSSDPRFVYSIGTSDTFSIVVGSYRKNVIIKAPASKGASLWAGAIESVITVEYTKTTD